MRREGIVMPAAGSAPQPVDAGLPPGAAAGPDAATSPARDAADKTPAPGAAAPAIKQMDTSGEVFRDERLSTYELTISNAAWLLLQQTALDERYVPAQLAVDGHNVGQVGVRYKGTRS